MKFEEWYKTVDGHLSPHPRMIALAGWNAGVEQAAKIAADQAKIYTATVNYRRIETCETIRDKIRKELK